MKERIPIGKFREPTGGREKQKTLPSITEAISESPRK